MKFIRLVLIFLIYIMSPNNVELSALLDRISVVISSMAFSYSDKAIDLAIQCVPGIQLNDLI